MHVQKWWRWLLSKRLPNTAKTRKYTSRIYLGVVWNLCILTYIFHFVNIGMASTEAQKAALLKYHQKDTVHSITINGLKMVDNKVIPPGMVDLSENEHSEIDL